MLKKINGFFKIGIIFLLFAIITIAIGMAKSQDSDKDLSKLKVISDEDTLRSELNGRPRKYIIMNAPLTGDFCEDKLGILSEDFIYAEYSSYYYTYRSRANDSMMYDTNWDWGDTVVSAGKNLCIFGDIPLIADDYKMYCNYVDLSRYVKPEYSDKIGYDNSIPYYYPNEIKDTKDNKRYGIEGVVNNQEVVFIATVGNGKVVLSSLYDGAELTISGFNDMSSLKYTQDESSGTLGLIGFAMLILAVILFILGILDILGKVFDKKK